jgi:hypothetical protein
MEMMGRAGSPKILGFVQQVLKMPREWELSRVLSCLVQMSVEGPDLPDFVRPEHYVLFGPLGSAFLHKQWTLRGPVVQWPNDFWRQQSRPLIDSTMYDWLRDRIVPELVTLEIKQSLWCVLCVVVVAVVVLLTPLR